MSALAGQPGVYVSEPSNGFPSNTWGWFRGWIELTASATATPRYMHAVNLSAAAGNVTITLPAAFPAVDEPYYFGFTNDSTVADGSKVVIVQTSAAVEVVRLSAAGETVWLARNPANGNWRQIAYDNPSAYQWTWADATARLACLANVTAVQAGKTGYQTDMQLEYELYASVSPAPLRWGMAPDRRLGALGIIQGQASGAGVTSLGRTTALTGGTAVNATQGTLASSTPRTQITTTGVASAFGRCRASPNICGNPFRVNMRFTTDQIQAGARYFVGIAPFAAVDSYQDPGGAAFINVLGVGRTGLLESNLQLIRNDGAGLPVVLDVLGTSATAIALLEFDIYYISNTVVFWQFTNRTLATYVSGSLTTQLPAPTAQSDMAWYIDNGGVASISLLGLVSGWNGQQIVYG